ncbi:hypothetical protein ParaKuw1_00043 [Paracoccus phage ParKuw1]|uniref:Uncharacterized protein n=1 Tax=Paracoccus phage ParKuw1 TaxID=3032415 RepID=A0AAF0FJU0_9CAUD|nr:hypothetical protein ParaKuw1_00043 [Paracoccus phage ParKuw1]
MKEADIIYRAKAALSFAARGGLRASLFVDTVAEDAEMLMAEVLKGVPKSQTNVVERAITEWRNDHAWLAGLPDKIEGENLQ